MHFAVWEHGLHFLGATLILINLAVVGLIAHVRKKKGGNRKMKTEGVANDPFARTAATLPLPLKTEPVPAIAGTGLTNVVTQPETEVAQVSQRPVEEKQPSKQDDLGKKKLRGSRHGRRPKIRKNGSWRYRAALIAHAFIASGAIFGLLSVEHHRDSAQKQSTRVAPDTPVDRNYDSPINSNR